MLIWFGLTYQRYPGLLSMVTVVPPNDFGKLPSQVVAALARFAPKIEIARVLMSKTNPPKFPAVEMGSGARDEAVVA